MAIKTTLEGFSLSHAQVLDGETDFLSALADATAPEQDVYGVNQGSLTPNMSDYDNEGDDAVLSTWSWLNYADVDVQAGYLSLDLIARLTGQTVDTTTTGDPGSEKDEHRIDLWHEDSINVAPKPMLLRIPAKDSDGVPADLVIGLYRVQFRPITFNGPQYKDGLKVNYQGRAVMSAVDEEGNAFTDGKRRVGTLIAIER